MTGDVASCCLGVPGDVAGGWIELYRYGVALGWLADDAEALAVEGANAWQLRVDGFFRAAR
jgi:hypothetical protein